MRAGPLRHRVELQLCTEFQDSAGDMVPQWAPVFREPLWAEIRMLMGRELIAAQSIHPEVTGRIKMRYRPGLNSKLRAVHRGTIYDIKAVIPDPESGIDWVHLLVSTGVNEG